MATAGNTLGKLIRAVRKQHGWTLREMSNVVGIPLSTLAKVETEKLSLTYDKLQQLASRLGMSLAEFLGQDASSNRSASPVVIGRRSVTGAPSTVKIETPNYDYNYLCSDLAGKRMVPILVRIRAGSVQEFGELVTHRGEEFVYVLEGSVEVHLQFYTPVVLTQGEGIYVDSSMQHAYIAKECESALVLAVCSDEGVDLAVELINLARTEKR